MLLWCYLIFYFLFKYTFWKKNQYDEEYDVENKSLHKQTQRQKAIPVSCSSSVVLSAASIPMSGILLNFEKIRGDKARIMTSTPTTSAPNK
jgi:hypothetical protein